MASISRNEKGFVRILFVGADGNRKALHLGKMPEKRAQSFKVHIEDIIGAQLSGQRPDDDTSRWIAKLEPKMNGKLAAVGLIPKRESATLEAYLDAYITGRTDVKPGTATHMGHTRRCLVEFFGAGKQLRDITPGDADRWRLWLADHEKLADNTIRRRCGIAKQFFRAAIRRRLVTENPFADLKAAVHANREKFHFITREVADKVLAACPDAQWRLLFALSRYGGLRCPSEHLSLKWGDVNWEQNRIRVPSPKTEHIEGHAERFIPLFPELRPYLEAVYDEAEEGTEWVITRCRMANVNLRTRLLKIIRRAGLKPWPKLFQNLRSTRQTELAEDFPMHVVTAWIGNSEAVALKHYLQVTDDHFAQAIEKTTHRTTQTTAGDVRQLSTPLKAENEKTRGSRGLTEVVNVCTSVKVGDEGFEPPTSTV